MDACFAQVYIWHRFGAGIGLELAPVELIALLKMHHLNRDTLQANSRVEAVVNFVEHIWYYVRALLAIRHTGKR